MTVLNKYQHRILLICIITAAIWLRFKGLVFQSYWADEIVTLALAQPDNTLLQVINSALRDNTTPLYQVLMWSWFNIFGFTEYHGRSLSAVIGTCSVITMYYLAKEYISRRAAIIAALIATTNQYLIYYSQEARSYQLLFLLAALSLLFLSRFLRKKTSLEFYIYTLLCVCLVQTHYYGILVYLVQASLILIHAYFLDPGNAVIKKRFWINSGITFLSLLPAMPYLVKNAQRTEFWIQTPEPFFFIDYFNKYFPDGLLASFFTVLMLAGLYNLWGTPDQRKKNILYLVPLSLLFIYLLPYIYSLLSLPMLMPKYTIGMLPVILLLSCEGLEFINYRSTRFFLVVFLILLSINVLFIENNYYRKVTKEQYREALEYIASYNEKPVVYYKYDSLKLYSTMLGYKFDIRETSKTSLEDIRKNHGDFWLILRYDRLFTWSSLLDDKFEFIKAKDIKLQRNNKLHNVRVLQYVFVPGYITGQYMYR